MSNNTTEQQVSLFAGMAVTAAPAAAAPRAHAAPQARVSLSNLGSGSGDDEGAQQGGAGPSKKRRTRNQDQMQQNRVAQVRHHPVCGVCCVQLVSSRGACGSASQFWAC